MSFLPLIIEFFLRGKGPQPTNIFLKALGYILLIVGLIIGFFLLIQILGVELNSLEITTIISVLMIVVGGILLITAKRKKKITNPATDIVDVTKDFLKSADLKNLIQNNAVKITSVALFIGFVLSHLMSNNDRKWR